MVLESECTQDKPSAKSVRRLMKSTFNGKFKFGQMKCMTDCCIVLAHHIYITVGRRTWILKDAPSVPDVLEKFPPLKKTRFVS